jgi:hypothetical protein
VALAAAAFALVLAASGCGVGGERTLATVGERRITVAEFEAAARERPYLSLDPSPETKRALLNELVERALLVAEARQRGFDKGPELAGVRREARETALQEMLYERVITDRVRTTPAEARALWEDQDEQWRISQIFCFTDAEAREVEVQLRAGRPFAEVARRFSRDAATAAVGGDLGNLTAGQLPVSTERAVRASKIGEWRGPLRTPIGIYFIQVTERGARERADFDASREPLEQLLAQRKSRALVLAYIARVKQKAHLRPDSAGLLSLTRNWQNRTPDELLAAGGDPVRLGFTPAELDLPLVRYDGGAYTIRDFFDDFARDPRAEVPPSTRDATLRLYLEDRATGRLLTREAEHYGLDRDPEASGRLRDREESHLVTVLYENVVVPAATLTAAEREEIAAQGIIEGDPATRESVLADLEAQRFEAKRQMVLRKLLDTLRERQSPRIDDRVLEAVPWPVPPKEIS